MKKCQLFFVVEGIPLDFEQGLCQSTGSSNVDILLWENECVCLLLQRKCMMLDYVCCLLVLFYLGARVDRSFSSLSTNSLPVMHAFVVCDKMSVSLCLCKHSRLLQDGAL